MKRLLHTTHEVLNQSPILKNYNVFTSDSSLSKFLKSVGADEYSHLRAVGEICGSEKYIDFSDKAEKNKPVLVQFDRFGNRIDVIDYHPAYHELMSSSIRLGGIEYGYRHSAHLQRACIIYMLNQLEPGHCCPIVMSCAAIPVLRKLPAFAEWHRQLLTGRYDPSFAPLGAKSGATVGMSMTEKQGGSDVRSNTTLATPSVGRSATDQGSVYTLRGHKWFTSAPMSDGFLTLAQTTNSRGETGLSCFLVPRWRTDGTVNRGFRVMRLKDKLGDRANASSEVEYWDAQALLVSEVNRGVRTIIEMVQSTRLDCALGSAAGMRRALHLALHHCTHRSAFGRCLVDQPLMRGLLADLCVESEAHSLSTLRLAHMYDSLELAQGANGPSSESEEAIALYRLLVPVCKYYVTKRQPQFVYECIEALGGNGFVEDFPGARLYRQAPLNSIWEGSGNVIALDVLKALGGPAAGLLLRELRRDEGLDASYKRYVNQLEALLRQHLSAAGGPEEARERQSQARLIADRIAVAFEAGSLLRHSDPLTAAAYIRTRLLPLGGAAEGLHFNSFTSNYGAAQYSTNECEHLINSHLPA